MDEQIEQLKKDVEKTSSGRGGIGWGILGFFIPIVGIVLFFVWRKNNKKSSKAAGIGALIGVIISVILTVVYFVWLGSFLLWYNPEPTNNTLSVTYQYGAAGECSFPDYLVRKEQESDSEFCSRIKEYKDVYNTIIISYSGLGSENLFKLDEEYTTISKDGYLSKYFENCNY